jgi:hypothetical protein
LPIDSHLDYLQKHAVAAPQILNAPQPQLRIVVVTTYLEDAQLKTFAEEISHNRDPNGAVEVIAISDQGDFHGIQTFLAEKNQQAGAAQALETTTSMRFYAIEAPANSVPQTGGALLLKIGMDEAIHRFQLAGQPDGIIVVVDAGKKCPLDFLEKIQREFLQRPKVQTLGIETLYERSEYDPVLGVGQLCVQLAERMFVAGLKFCGHPYAFPMMEIAFAARASAYQAQAGMSKRKLRPTFDFLQKFVELGTHHHCLTTQVLSRTIATNNPDFEIGYAIWKYAVKPDPRYPVFHAESFIALQTGIQGCQNWFSLSESQLQAAAAGFPKGFREFMAAEGFVAKVVEMKRYTKTAEAFEKRFFRWFNSLKTLHYFHHCRDHHWPNQPIEDVGNQLAAWMEGDPGIYMEFHELSAYFEQRARAE